MCIIPHKQMIRLLRVPSARVPSACYHPPIIQTGKFSYIISFDQFSVAIVNPSSAAQAPSLRLISIADAVLKYSSAKNS